MLIVRGCGRRDVRMLVVIAIVAVLTGFGNVSRGQQQFPGKEDLPSLVDDSGGADTVVARAGEAPEGDDHVDAAFWILLLIIFGMFVGVIVWGRAQKKKLATAREGLAESDRRFFQVLENAHIPMILVGGDGTLQYINSWYVEKFGHTREDVADVEQWLAAVIPDENYRVNARECYDLAVRNSAGIGEEVDMKFWRINSKNGVLREVDLRYISLGENGLLTIEDVTARKQREQEKQSLEAEVARTRKMEVVGRMAGAVAHDLNNLLAGVVSYPELILMEEGLAEDVLTGVKGIQMSGKKAAALVADLLMITRSEDASREVTSLNTIVEGCLQSPEAAKLKEAKPELQIETDLDDQVMNISAASTHVSQAVLSLLKNAFASLPDSGQKPPKIRVRTANLYVDKPYEGREPVPVGEYALVSVTHNGSALSDEAREQLFEPFYDKKKLGLEGVTGLGMCLAYHVAKAHYGYIDLRSGDEETAVELLFPISRGELPTSTTTERYDDYAGSGQKILVVDDESSQREIACMFLNKLGYQAKAVNSGDEAVLYLEKNPADLVILDMVMPGLNGRETYEKILESHPGQKAVITSGYPEGKEVRKAQKLGAGNFIKKPYSLAELGLAVKSELGAKSD